MAWTHFTAPLVDGQIFTAAMRAELLAALDERLKAANPAWGLTAGGDHAVLEAAGLATRRLSYTGPDIGGDRSLAGAVAALGASYRRPEFFEGAGGSITAYSGVFADAEADLGLPAGASSTFRSSVLDTRGYWNLIRAALMRLRWLELSVPTGASEFRDGGLGALDDPPVSFATAKARWIGGSHLPAPGQGSVMRGQQYLVRGPFGGSTDYYLLTYKAVGTLSVPTAAPWVAGWSPAFTGTSVNPGGGLYDAVAARMGIQMAGESWLFVAPPFGGAWQAGGHTSPIVSATGAVTLEMVGGAEVDADEWDDMLSLDPGSGRSPGMNTPLSRIFGRPTFTHP